MRLLYAREDSDVSDDNDDSDNSDDMTTMMTVTKLPKPKPNPWINILNMLDVNQRLLKVFKALFLNKFYILMIKFDGIYS